MAKINGYSNSLFCLKLQFVTVNQFLRKQFPLTIIKLLVDG